MKNYIIDIKFTEGKEDIEKELQEKLKNISSYLYYYLTQYTEEIEIDVLIHNYVR